MLSFLDIENEDLARLGSEEGVKVFEYLIWAEAYRLGIPYNQINVSRKTTVSDGGVDASVNDPNFAGTDGLIVAGFNSYQIKTGAGFKPNQKAQLKNEVIDKSSGKVKQEIARCLEEGGRYVLVCFGSDLTDKAKNTAEKNYMWCWQVNSKTRELRYGLNHS